MILSAPKSEKYGIKLESLACFYAILDTCVYFLCVCVVPGCEQESQISRQRRTVVPSVPQNAEKEARSLFAKEVLSLLSSPVCVFSCFSGYRKIIQGHCVFVPCEKEGNTCRQWRSWTRPACFAIFDYLLVRSP